MRGRFVDQGGLFSYVSPEARVPATHPLRNIRQLVRDVLGEMSRNLGKLRERRTSLDPPRTIAERIATTGVLRHSVGAPVDGATGLQPFMPLVRGIFTRRPGVGTDHFHQEP